ncbi:MBL fold metallo-hydrolase [Streptomyces hoynatensis]|uniref:MBL fold metallo-hydrolase n=1 Tax=Streptomyces hoynatensis TaxID=1141874 RepID=A0A3A9YSV0_9ACTN|nr:MBL fold metallo-hydrolase [Streptomyces hoynatensis]RKN38584.1 MBL fold metallo-hydrolase [Streptomyces hoynatensis]
MDAWTISEVLPGLHRFTFPLGEAYLWCERDALALIDAGPPGSGPALAKGIASLGRRPEEVRHLVLTHHHGDHTGSAAEIAAWGEVTVSAHRLDAPVIRHAVPPPEPDLSDAPGWERELFAKTPRMFAGPPCRVDRELEDGDLLDFAGGARVVATPGHTAGSIGVHLPAHRVLFTGDTAANPVGTPMFGVFHRDRRRAFASFGRLAELDVDTACFGHGDPVVGAAGAALRAAAAAGLPE